MLDAWAHRLELKGVYSAKKKIKSTIKKILIASGLIVFFSLLSGLLILLTFIPIIAILFYMALVHEGRNYSLINKETILLALQSFILANAGFDVVGIFEKLARMKEYESSYIFRKIIGIFRFGGKDLRHAINAVMQEEKGLGTMFKEFLSSIYNGLITGIDVKTMFTLIIQQQAIEGEKDMEKFDEYTSSFLSSLMPVVVTLPLVMVLFSSTMDIDVIQGYAFVIAVGVAIFLFFLFSENKFLYYPEEPYFNGKVLLAQILGSVAVSLFLLNIVGIYAPLIGSIMFFVIGYALTRDYINVRKDIFIYLPVFFGDLSNRISIGQTFTEAVTSMPMEMYGHFSKVLKFSLGNLLLRSKIPHHPDYDRIYVYKIYKRIIEDMQKGIYGYEALTNIRLILSLMSSIYDKVRSSLNMQSFMISFSLALSIFFVDVLRMMGEQISTVMINVETGGQQNIESMKSIFTILSFFMAKPWIVWTYVAFATIFIVIFGIFVSSVTDGSRHGNMISIMYAIVSVILTFLIHDLLSPMIMNLYR